VYYYTNIHKYISLYLCIYFTTRLVLVFIYTEVSLKKLTFSVFFSCFIVSTHWYGQPSETSSKLWPPQEDWLLSGMYVCMYVWRNCEFVCAHICDWNTNTHICKHILTLPMVLHSHHTHTHTHTQHTHRVAKPVPPTSASPPPAKVPQMSNVHAVAPPLSYIWS